MLIVMKFGGSSLATLTKIENAARIIAQRAAEGNSVVVVVSARGKTTDELVRLAGSITKNPPPRENDVLLSTGEHISMSLMAMQLIKMGVDAVSLSGSQAGIITDARHGSATILRINTERILLELSYGRVVIVAGFQGVNENDDTTTLGRGGSDTTAIALAAALKSDICCIYTDVRGVYSANPNVAADAVLYREISYDEMLEMSALGASVLHSRSVSLAKHRGVVFEVRSSSADEAGTLVHEYAPGRYVSGIVCDGDVAMLTVDGISQGDATCALFNALARGGITVDVILRSQRSLDSVGTVSFSVSGGIVQAAYDVISQIGYSDSQITVERDLCKISAVGAGLSDTCCALAAMLSCLHSIGIEPRYITTGEIRISVLIDRAEEIKAQRALNALFFRSNET